jgi:hypothetical protein
MENREFTMRRPLSAALLSALAVGLTVTTTSTAYAAPGCIETSGDSPCQIAGR